MDCSDKSLELDSILDLGNSLETGQTYAVRVNGEAALTFTAPWPLFQPTRRTLSPFVWTPSRPGRRGLATGRW
ncbi:MAG: hypothetical protein F4X18_09910 [Acidimicrobiia bacterium]|nr:hypothetical protein [Acidimicrobiia bacterium]